MSEVLETLSGSMLSWNITQQAETSETVTRFTATQAQQEQEQSAEKADPWPRLLGRQKEKQDAYIQFEHVTVRMPRNAFGEKHHVRLVGQARHISGRRSHGREGGGGCLYS